MNNDKNISSLYRAFFSLLRAGLWNIAAEEVYFPLSDKQWLEIFQIAYKQTVQGIIYDGIITLRVELYPPKSLMLKWIVAIDNIENQNHRMSKRIKELFGFFAENKLDAYLLKGHSVASCYPQPDHRVCGDIDVYFSKSEDRKRAHSLLMERGIQIKKTPGYSTEYTWKETLVEHHEKMLDVHNPFVIKGLQILARREYSRSAEIKMEGENVPSPSPLMTTLLVNTHILKHTLSFGIGLRQLCDSAMICYAYHNQVDGIQLKKIYKQIGILRWIHVLNQVLVKYLGLNSQFLPFELNERDDSSWMVTEVLESGNFGFEDTRFGENIAPQSKRTNALKHLTHRFFLNIRYAPGEAISFPFVQFFSRIATYF